MRAPIRIGILGASRIAPRAVIEPARDNPEFEVMAIAAREAAKAKAYAVEHDIARVAADYAELVGRDDIDLVYNALPASAHAEWSIAALNAGKAVLCEKPFTRNAAEAHTLVAVAEANGQVLIEAFHNRFHAVMRRALEICTSGELGALESAEAVFDVPIPYTATELRWSRDLGGGALMDLGCYCVHAVRTCLREEPRVEQARADVRQGVDASMESEWSFPSGARGRIACSMIAQDATARFSVKGARGSLESLNFVAPQMGCRFTVTIDGKTRQEPTAGATTYAAQLRHVGDVLLRGAKPLTGGLDSIRQMEAIDATYMAAGMDRSF